MTAPDIPLDRLYSVRELWQLGYGSKNSIRALIADGVVPAVMVGNRFKVAESDLHLIAVPVPVEGASA